MLTDIQTRFLDEFLAPQMKAILATDDADLYNKCVAILPCTYIPSLDAISLFDANISDAFHQIHSQYHDTDAFPKFISNADPTNNANSNDIKSAIIKSFTKHAEKHAITHIESARMSNLSNLKIHSYMEALKLLPKTNPLCSVAYFELGVTYRDTDYNYDAVRHFTNVINNFPESKEAPYAYLYRGQLLNESKRYESAKSDIENAIKMLPPYDTEAKAAAYETLSQISKDSGKSSDKDTSEYSNIAKLLRKNIRPNNPKDIVIGGSTFRALDAYTAGEHNGNPDSEAKGAEASSAAAAAAIPAARRDIVRSR